MQISASISFDGFYVYENSEFLAISFNLSLLFQGIFSSPHFNVGRSSFSKVNKDHMFPIATSLRAPEFWSWFVQPGNYSLGPSLSLLWALGSERTVSFLSVL